MEKIDKIEEWIKNADVDGRGILFKFTDKDAEELKYQKFLRTLYVGEIKEIDNLLNKIINNLPQENNLNFNRNSIISVIKNEFLIFKKSKLNKREVKKRDI